MAEKKSVFSSAISAILNKVFGKGKKPESKKPGQPNQGTRFSQTPSFPERPEKEIAEAENGVRQAKKKYKNRKISAKKYHRRVSAFKYSIKKLRKKKAQLEKHAGIREKEAQENEKKETISHEHVKEIEKHVRGFIKKYDISLEEIEKDVEKLDKEKILRDFHKLIGVLEIAREAKRIDAESRETPAKPIVEKKGKKATPKATVAAKKNKQSLQAIAKEIQKYKIVTDFDRLLNMVQEKGSVNSDQAMKELGIKEDDFVELVEILEKNGLVKVIYPPIGKMRIEAAGGNAAKSKEKKGVAQLINNIKQKKEAKR